MTEPKSQWTTSASNWRPQPYRDRHCHDLQSEPLVQQVRGDAALAANQIQALAAPGELANNYDALARAFWVDEAVGSRVHLDGVVAVVDASRIVRAERHCASSQ